jgi:signal transduction histidine kinase
MATDSMTTKTWNSYSDTVDSKSSNNNKAGKETHEAASLNLDSQQLLLQAQKNAEEAKEAALGAISRFYEQSQVSEKKAEKMVKELDDAIQHALTATQKTRVKNPGNSKQDEQDDDPTGLSLLGKDKKVKLSKKVLNNGPFGIGKGLFNNTNIKEMDPEVKAEFYQYVMRHSPQLRDLIDELTEDKARLKTEKILNEARAEILAARAAVNRTQEETNDIKEKARKAMAEAEATKRSAELVVNQVRQSTIGQVAEEVTKAREEVKAVKVAAEHAVRKAEEELARVKADAGAANNKATVTITLAQEKIRKDTEALKNYKLQAKIAVKQAMDEANRMKEEAEAIRREAQEIINKSAQESQKAQKDMETASKLMQDATNKAEKQAYEKFCDELTVIRNETEATNKAAYEAITRAREETLHVREELEIVRKTSEESLNLARQEAAIARAEAQNARQKAQESLRQAQDEARKAKEEADAAMLKASETMLKAKEDLISMTRGEISRVRQEIEAVGNGAEIPADKLPARNEDAQVAKVDSNKVATVLHEIRTPLHSISGFAKLMLEEDVADPTTRKEFLSLMVQQSESLNRQIEDLSGILNNSFGVFTLEKEHVSAAKLVSEGVDGVKVLAEQKKSLIHRSIPPSLPEIDADILRVKEVIANLLTNAIKYSPEKSNILVKAEARDNELLVQVMDRGCGIPAADIPKIFDRYYRASNHANVPGSGLGLYVCRQIVEAHYGKIWVESVEGQGSTFSFTLPLPSAR